MKFFIYYLLIYLLEAIAIGRYTAHVFMPKRGKKTRLFFLFSIYSVLLLIFYLNITWLNVSGFFLGNLVYILYCYDTGLSAALFHSGAATVLMCACELIAYPFTYQAADDTQYFMRMVLWAILSKPLYAVSLIFLSRAIHEEANRSDRTDSLIWSLICFPVVSSVIMFILYMLRTSYRISTEHEQMISAGAILLLFANVLVIYIYIHSRKRNRIFTQMQLSLQKEHDLSEHYQNMLQQDESQRILIHDIKNHLHTIALLNRQNAPEQVADYIQQITQSPVLAYSARICDHKLLNLILSQYQQRCMEQDIRFLADVQNHAVDFMKENDMTSLFCNLLDNAVESAKLTQGGRIELKIGKQAASSHTVITLVNSCQASPYAKDGRKLISRKKNPSRHGYGLKSVERTADRYDGKMETYFDAPSGDFHTVIMLCQS